MFVSYRIADNTVNAINRWKVKIIIFRKGNQVKVIVGKNNAYRFDFPGNGGIAPFLFVVD